MSEGNEAPETVAAPETETETAAEAEPQVEAAVERKRMPKVDTRFLYVAIASRRAKQLRRGALPRLDDLAPDPETGARPTPAHKLERIAMSEIDQGLIVYELPEQQSSAAEGS